MLSLMSIFAKDRNQQFWNWFSANADSYFNFENDQERLFGELSKHLSKVSPYATFLFSPIENGKREFILSPDGIRAGAQVIKDLVAAAPKFDTWNIVAFRPRIALEQVSFEGINLARSDVKYEYAFQENNLIKLELYVPGYEESQKEAYMGAAFLLLDAVIGEYDVITKIGVIEFKTASIEPNEGLRPLTSLAELVDSRQDNPIT